MGSSNGQDAYLDLQYLSLIRSSHPRAGGSVNLFNEQQPLSGEKNSWTWITGLGLHWENRDNEIAPTSGSTAVLDIMAGPGVASDHAMWPGRSAVDPLYYAENFITGNTGTTTGLHPHRG